MNLKKLGLTVDTYTIDRVGLGQVGDPALECGYNFLVLGIRVHQGEFIVTQPATSNELTCPLGRSKGRTSFRSRFGCCNRSSIEDGTQQDRSTGNHRLAKRQSSTRYLC